MSISAWAKRLQEEVARGAEFTCLLTSDSEIRRLNRKFRDKDAATDVLSFPAAKGLDGAGVNHLGDVAISVERARVQAREEGHTVEEEIGVLMLHGVLHLLGMDHERDSGVMRRAEARWRKRLSLPPGLTERSAAERGP
jgi:probable rRNA maturation factor